MSKLIDQAVAAIRQLPAETQDDVARFLIAFADRARTGLTADEAAAIAEAEAEIARGEQVPAATVAGFWRAHGI